MPFISISPASSPLVPEYSLSDHSAFAMCVVGSGTLTTASGDIVGARLRAWKKNTAALNALNP